jgi:hypothetical protein
MRQVIATTHLTAETASWWSCWTHRPTDEVQVLLLAVTVTLVCLFMYESFRCPFSPSRVDVNTSTPPIQICRCVLEFREGPFDAFFLSLKHSTVY